jgi:plasmid stability protein
MRTTVNLDPDLERDLRALARERGRSFTAVVNDVLRRGLSEEAPSAARPYRLETHRLGLRPGIDLQHALRLAGELEDAETIRKLELRK